VAVVGWGVVQELGYVSAGPLLGQRIHIAGRPFQVIGVMSPKGRAEANGDPDLQVLIPLRAGRFRLFGTNWLSDIYVLAASDAEVPLAMTEIRSILRRVHRTPPDAPDDFRIRNQSDFLTTMSESTAIFTYLLAGIAAVSIVVGGVGIMNIMLVSVTERTREIGIRRALGARRRTILTQFLVEAVAICIAGGVIGVLVGGAILLVLREGFGWATIIAPQAVVGGVVFSAGVGILFGVWPARRAASLDPIGALRYE
jgi:putative ABC transport system permease protein